MPDNKQGLQLGFIQGYTCAICSLIRQNGMVTTDALELWKCGSVKTLEDIVKYSIDESDAEIILTHKSELLIQ